MIRNFTLTNALGDTFSLMNAQQGAYFNPSGLGFDDVTEYEQVGEFFAPLTQRFGQQVISGVMVFGAKPYESYLTFTKFCQHSPLSLIYETDAGAFQIPCRLTKIEKGDTDGWTYLECAVEFTALARMYKTVTANNTGTAGGGKVYLEKEGKNKLPVTVANIKSENSGVTWNGNATTINGITFTIQTDTDGNVIGINANGTATANVSLFVSAAVDSGVTESCTLTGCPSGGSSTTYFLTINYFGYDYGSGRTGTIGTQSNRKARIDIKSGTSVSNLVFKPMLRLASETDATYEPYWGKTYGYKYNYTYGDFVADTVTIDSDSVTASPCRISIFGECTQPTWRHYLDGNSVATGYYNGTIPDGHKLVIDTTSSPYSIEEQDISGNLIADRYELCDFSTERFFLLEYGHNTISVSHTDPDSIRLLVEGYIFYETV